LVIKRTFEVLTLAPPDTAAEILRDLELHLPLWSIFESMNKLSENEAQVKLRIAGALYDTRVKLEYTSRGKGHFIKVNVQGQVNFTLTYEIMPRGAGSIISGSLVFRAGFLRERLLGSSIVTFIDDLKNKLIFQLPAIAEAFKSRKAAQPPPRRPTLQPAIRQPTMTPAAVSEKRKQEETKPKEAKATTRAKEGEEIRTGEFIIADNPSALEDPVVLGSIILKASLEKTEKIATKGTELLNELSKFIEDVAKKGPVYANIRTEKINVKVLIKDKKIIGLRIEEQDKPPVNGSEAVKKLKELGELSGRIYVFSVPEDVLSSIVQ
jgi:hypothetical protein